MPGDYTMICGSQMIWNYKTLICSKRNHPAVSADQGQSNWNLIAQNLVESLFLLACLAPLTLVCTWLDHGVSAAILQRTVEALWLCAEMINTAPWDKGLTHIQLMYQIPWPFIPPISITQIISPHYKHPWHELGLFSDWLEYWS